MIRKMTMTVCFIALLFMSQGALASAYDLQLKPGAAIGKLQQQKSTLSINGVQVPSYSFRNSSWISVSDLNQYGFDVTHSKGSNLIRVSRNTSKPIKRASLVAAKPTLATKQSVSYTNMGVYIENRKVTTYQIDNKNVIRFSDLSVFGQSSQKGNKINLQLAVNNTYNNKMNLFLTDNKIYNLSGSNLQEVELIHLVMKDGKITQIRETLYYLYHSKTAEIALKEGFPYELDGMYLGTVLEKYGNEGYETIENEHFEKDIAYYSTPSHLKDALFLMEKEYDLLVKLRGKYKQNLKEELKNNKYRPLKVLDVNVSYNSIGTPEIEVSVKNVTEKNIVAFEVTLIGYDSYDRVVRNSINKRSYFKGIAQHADLGTGSSASYTWDMFLHDNTVKANAKITSVRYSDGSVWRAK
ncbi:hypothetical protein [Paenibacillus sp. 481]|uniref:hypothetical protein n=1 Tax=Paenibacillus sp. 481 TaxID=2835869 RepID=UPI001E590F90|nr:hypothetical protein [Paenibacillus sp. 481]UHA73017.1 hypothetical protein KIK04_20810 [Paenibacillus sp. 481]